jgi:hypothetical protein
MSSKKPLIAKNTSKGLDNEEDTNKGVKTITPKAYVLQFSDPRFTFKNFYIEYGRFHQDQTNVLIHIVFIPVIMYTFFGFISEVFPVKHLKVDLTNGLNL